MTKVSPPNPLLPVTPSPNLVAPLPGPLTTPDVSNRQGLLPNIPRQGLPITQTAATKVLETSANAFPVPKTLDDVANGQIYAKVLAEYISNGVVHNFRGIWNSTTAYNIGDEVLYSNAYWVSLANNTNSTPNRNNSNWQAVGTYNGYTGAWSSTTTYNPGDEVTYNGNYWVCVTQNTNSAPSTSNSNWVIAGPSNLDYVADGTSRFAVKNMAGGNAVASVDSNNLAIIDFSQTHVHKTIDYVPDGTTRYAVKNMANGNAVASVDSNNLALIDFSQSGHVHKTIDYVPNGTTYARPLGSTLVNGYPAYRTSAASILAQSPTHYWPLDNNSYTDLGSSPSNLTLVGSATTSGLSLAPGDAAFGTALSNGSSALYGTATAATTWTIMCWVMPGSGSWANASGIIGRTAGAPFGSVTANEPHLCVDTSGYFYACIWNGSTIVIKSSVAFSPTIPHHVAVTLGGGVLTLYVDGTSVAQATGLAAEQPGSENIWEFGTAYGTFGSSPLASGWNTNSNGTNLQDVAIWEGKALYGSVIQAIYNSGAGQIHDLSTINDSPTFRRLGGVSPSNQATTSSITANAVTSSITQTTTSYVNITTSGQIASATITPNGGYVTLKVCGAIASTNTSASGWGLTFYKAGTAMSPAFSYQGFASPGNDKYEPFCFIIPDTSPGTSQVTYSVSVSTNSGGTVSLIPVEFIVENMKV